MAEHDSDHEEFFSSSLGEFLFAFHAPDSRLTAEPRFGGWCALSIPEECLLSVYHQVSGLGSSGMYQLLGDQTLPCLWVKARL